MVIGLSTEPKNLSAAKNAYLIIGYSKNFSCVSIVSALIIKGQRLGTPTDQKTSKSFKNQLVVIVNGNEYTSQTKMTMYTNGIELAMKGSEKLVSALSNVRNRLI